MTYSIYWKKVTEENWHKLTSQSPISYTRQLKTPDFEGGQCPVGYEVHSSYYDEFYQRYWWGGGNWIPRAYGSVRQVIGPIYGLVPVTTPSGTKELYIHHAGGMMPTGLGWSACQDNPEFYRNCRWQIDWVRRLDNQPDSCGSSGGECVTKFFSDGSLIGEVTDKTCVEVSEKQPECECCGMLLPKANSILMRLP